MDKETVEKKIKNEIEMFKVYALFIITLGAGDVSFLLRSDILQNKLVLYLLFAGVVFFIIFVAVFITSFIKIYRLSKKL